jgi:predicted dehydrogenase
MAQALNVAVLGCGMISERAHIPGLLASGRAEVKVLYGPDTARSRRLAGKFAIPALVHSMDEVFQRPDLDAVVIALPNFQHGPAAMRAVAARLPMLCEKPLAADIATSRAVVAAAEAAGVMIAMHLPHRHRPVVRELKRLLRSGIFGKLQSLDVRILRRAGIPGFGSWFTRRDLAGGGVLTDLGPHAIDIALWLADFPDIVDERARMTHCHGSRGLGLGEWGVRKAVAAADPGQFDVEDQASVTLTCRSGAVLGCEVAWARFGPNENRIHIVGDRGGADYWPEVYGSQSPLRLFGYEQGEPSDRFATGFVADHADLTEAWASCMADFVACVASGGVPAASGREALKVAEVIATAYGVAERPRSAGP